MKKLFTALLSFFVISSAFAAISATKTKNISFGDVKGVIYSVTFTSVTGGAVYTGLSNLLHCSYAPASSDDWGIVYKNSKTASRTEDDKGVLYIDGVTSNDFGHIFCIGQ